MWIEKRVFDTEIPTRLRIGRSDQKLLGFAANLRTYKLSEQDEDLISKFISRVYINKLGERSVDT